MLRTIKSIYGDYELLATDGSIGKVNDFLFNDNLWIIKYLVADTGSWLSHRLVLLSPVSLGKPDWETKKIPVNLTTKKIEESPPLEKDKPVSLQRESEMIQYYAWPFNITYGIDSTTMGEMQILAERMRREQEAQEEKSEEEQNNPFLRSTREVSGYHIRAIDDEIGHIDDFIFEDDNWIIRYAVVDTRKWLPGKKVLISPEWIEKIDWAKNEVAVDLSREIIENGPEYDPNEPVNRNYEVQLYDYYGRPKYWE